jgi:hypothetical protein
LALLAAVFGGCSVADRPPAGESEIASDEHWDAIFVAGKHVGHAVTRTEAVRVSGAVRRRTANETQLSVRRFGGETLQTIRASTIELPNGQVQSFETVMISGDGRMELRGERRGNEFAVSVSANGQTRTGLFAVPDDCLGFFGVDQSLASKPMQLGERRSLTQLVPMVQGTGAVELVASKMEDTQLLNGSRRLLRIEARTIFPSGQEIETILWTDPQGQILKSVVGNLQSIIRTTRPIAIAHRSENLDIGADLLVTVDKRIEDPHQTKRVDYLARLKDGDPATTLCQSPLQSVQRVDSHTARVRVVSRRPTPSVDDGQPIDATYLAGNSMLQADDPEIIAMASSVARAETDRWQIAVELERYVKEIVSKKDFSTALASAAEVASSRAGDCTEHAVLLAALCRARRIPSRVAVGLIYHEPSSAFAYHMWTEVGIGGKWFPIDGTLGIGGVGACHLKISDTDFRNGAGLDSFVPVLKLMGNLSLEVLAVER